MASALRGDFERLRARRGETEPVLMPVAAQVDALPAEEQAEVEGADVGAGVATPAAEDPAAEPTVVQRKLFGRR